MAIISPSATFAEPPPAANPLPGFVSPSSFQASDPLADQVALPEPAPVVDASAGIPQSGGLPAKMADAFGENPWDVDQREETARLAAWREENQGVVDAMVADPDKAFKGVDFSWARGGVRDGQRLATNDAFLRLNSDGRDVPTRGLSRELVRRDAAVRLFDGRGAESEDAFHAEILRYHAQRGNDVGLSSLLFDNGTASAIMASTQPGANPQDWQATRTKLQSMPGYQADKEADYHAAFHTAEMNARAILRPYAPELRQVWDAMKAGGAGTLSEVLKAGVAGSTKGGGGLVGTVLGGADAMLGESARKDAGATAFDLYKGMPEGQRSEFMKALGLMAQSFTANERQGFFANMSKEGGKAVDELGRGAWESFVVMSSYLPAPGGMGDTPQMTEHKTAFREDYLARKNFANDVRAIESEQYKPLLEDDGSKPGWIKRGFYAMPGLAAMTAEAEIPGIGFPLMLLSMQDQAHTALRSNLMAGGMKEEDASHLSATMAPWVALPQAALMKVNAGMWLGKLPMFAKVMDGIGDKITNTGLRLAARAAVADVSGQAIMTGMGLVPNLAQAMVHALDSDVPAVQWGGKGGVFDGFWARQFEGLVTLGPLAILGAAGGVSGEARAKAFAKADPRELTALGWTKDAIAAKDVAAAKGQSSLNRAVDIGMLGADPNSEEAGAAKDEIIREHLGKTLLAAQANDAGLFPKLVHVKDGWLVQDETTGEEIGHAPDAAAALTIARNHYAGNEDLTADHIAYISSLMEAAQAVRKLGAGGDDHSVSLELENAMTEAKAAAENPDHAKRMADQTELKERINGGDGSFARSILGAAVPAHDGRGPEERLFQGGDVTDLFHETFHRLREEARASGRLTRADEITVLRSLDKVLGTKRTKDGSEALRFLPEGIADADVTELMLQEAAGELGAAEVLRSRKGGGKLGLDPSTRSNPNFVTRNLLSIAARVSPEAADAVRKFSNFIAAVRARWSLDMQRALAMKKAERDGDFDKAGYEAYLDKLLGRDVQKQHEAKVRELGEEIYAHGSAEDYDVPFSLGKGEPLLPSFILPLDSGGEKMETAANERHRDPQTVLSGITGQAQRISAGGIRTDGEKRRKYGRKLATGEELAVWAKENGRLLKSSGFEEVPDLHPIGGGEHKVLFDEESGRVVKLTKPGLFGAQAEDAGAYLQRWSLHNQAFSDDVMFEGIVTLSGETEPRAVISQRFAKGRDATTEEQADFLKEKGFIETPDGKWIHPVRGVAVWDTITPGNVIMTEDGARVIDLQISPADGKELADIREQSGIGKDTAFSIGPANLAGFMAGDAVRRMKDPLRRVQAMGSIARNFEALKLVNERLELLAGGRRVGKSLTKEAAMREAIRHDELHNEVWGRHYGILSDEDLTRIKSQPGHQLLGDPDSHLRGRVMSKAQALKDHPDMFRIHRMGEYDGVDGVGRSVFGGTLLPDQAAQELFAAHLIKTPTADAMWDLLRQEQNMVAKMKESHAKAKDEFRQARVQAREETNAWLAEQTGNQKENYSPKVEILRALAAMDAIMTALPPDIRGKLGGYTQMARLGSDAVRLEYLKDKLARADVMLEKWMRGSIDAEFRDLLKRTRPTKDGAGERPTGKMTPEVQDAFKMMEAAMTMDAAHAEAEAVKEESLAEAETTSAADAAKHTMQANLIRLAGNWMQASAARREEAFMEADRLAGGGFLASKILYSKRAERQQQSREQLIAGANREGTTGTLSERKEKESKAQQIGEFAKHFFYALFSFEHILHHCFGENDPEAIRLADAQRESSNRKSDSIFAHNEALNHLFTSLGGGALGGEKLRYQLGSELSVKIKLRSGEVLALTPFEAISATLMWRQEDGKRHMQGHLDDAGKPVGDWHYSQENMDAIEDQLSPEARAVRLHLVEQYGAEYDRINAVFRGLYGMNLPRHANYSPLTVKPQKTSNVADVDPVSGFANNGGITPGSLKNRSTAAIAEPDAPRASSAFQNETFMGIVGEVAIVQPGLDGVIEVDAGHLVTQRIENDRRQAAAVGDFEVDPGFEQGRGVQ
ncbi:MAG: hypothetical protein WCK77_14120 [Verrucomicrobiota bacterium]